MFLSDHRPSSMRGMAMNEWEAGSRLPWQQVRGIRIVHVEHTLAHRGSKIVRERGRVWAAPVGVHSMGLQGDGLTGMECPPQSQSAHVGYSRRSSRRLRNR